MAHEPYILVAELAGYNLRMVYGHGVLAHYNMYNLPSRMLRSMLEGQRTPT